MWEIPHLLFWDLLIPWLAQLHRLFIVKFLIQQTKRFYQFKYDINIQYLSIDLFMWKAISKISSQLTAINEKHETIDSPNPRRCVFTYEHICHGPQSLRCMGVSKLRNNKTLEENPTAFTTIINATWDNMTHFLGKWPIAYSVMRASLAISSYSTQAHGIIVKYMWLLTGTSFIDALSILMLFDR